MRDMSGRRDSQARFLHADLRILLRRLTAVTLALTHAALLSLGSSLHGYGPETAEIDIVDLPAQYHSHDFGLVQEEAEPAPADDDCLGCQLQRTVGPPPGAVSGLHGGATGTGKVGPPRNAAPPAWRDDPLSRAPPV